MGFDAQLLLGVDTWDIPPSCRLIPTVSSAAGKIRGGYRDHDSRPLKAKVPLVHMPTQGVNCPLHSFGRTESSTGIDSGILHSCSAGPEENRPEKSFSLRRVVGLNIRKI